MDQGYSLVNEDIIEYCQQFIRVYNPISNNMDVACDIILNKLDYISFANTSNLKYI